MIKIILPIYNESESIYDLLENYSKFFEKYPQEHLIYAINDKSTDDTAFYIEKALYKYKNLSIEYEKNSENIGLSETLKNSIKRIVSSSTENDILITMDGDNTQNPFTILSMLLKLEQGADLVIASRYCEGSRINGLSYQRIFLSQVAKLLYSLKWNIKGVKDYTSNYRAYRILFLKKLIEDKKDKFITEREFNGVGELLKNISEYNPITVEVPMILNYSNKKNASNINILKTISQTLKMLFLKKRI